MKKMLFFCVAILIFSGCTTTIKNYGMKNQTYPEWMLNYEFGRNYLGLQYDEKNKDRHDYDKNNFFIENNATFGNRNFEFRLLIDPQIDFKYLTIIEISYVKDGEKIFLVENRKIKNDGRRYTQLPEIKYRNFDKYFKNMKVGEKTAILLIQKYRFDDGPVITEEAPYVLTCFEDEYNPLNKLPFPTR
ncbi:MAG: hypothetical protein JW982_04455 [Spirochaetes bacterium]|nr:hypothetical protein [Spirochaetota bacterium]